MGLNAQTRRSWDDPGGRIFPPLKTLIRGNSAHHLTDILPFGDAWVRVHSLDLAGRKAPVIQNIQKPERSTDDDRWRYVRNTPFRKSIETVGSLLMDVLTLKLLGNTNFSSDERKG